MVKPFLGGIQEDSLTMSDVSMRLEQLCVEDSRFLLTCIISWVAGGGHLTTQ